MGVPGRHSSDHKHNPFLALATAARQSAKAAKRKSPPWDDNDPDCFVTVVGSFQLKMLSVRQGTQHFTNENKVSRK